MSLAAGLLCALALVGGGEEDATTRLPRVDVFPAAVSLETARDRQRVLVLATDADDVSVDRTADAAFEVADPGVARWEDGVLLPVAAGETTLWVYAFGQVRDVPVSVRDAELVPPLSFRLDALPVLTAGGCNSGACHGTARGQDGFHLSLFGFDPEGDHRRLSLELPGRRLNRSVPSASLLLEKAAGVVPHTGGKLLEPGSRQYETLLQWIEEGARDDGADVPTLTGIELYPTELVLEGSGRDLDLLVRARYSDGRDRDVTDLAVFRTSNEVSCALHAGGALTSGDPGEAFITASYGVHTVGVPVVVLPAGAAAEFQDPAEGLAAATWVDGLLEAKQRRLRLSPSGLCTDEEYVRRVTLDVVGLLPTTAERAAFLADERPSPEKRRALVETLLGRREFSELWVMKWAELLRVRSDNQNVSEKSALLYFEWLRDRIAANVPVDEMVRELLTASGGTFGAPHTNFYQVERDTLVLAENVAQSFLGIRLQCAKCHNHPFDRWTQDDYYGFAAFFGQIGRKRAEDPREYVVYDRRSGEVKHPVKKVDMPPKFLGGAVPDLGRRDRRAVIAEWITDPDNPWFARSLANRVWAHFMGPGIIEPVDDFRVSNPPSNGPLLDGLAERLVATGYDFKELVREITASRAYQRSTRSTQNNAHDARNATHAQVRRMRAETLLDMICQATGAPEKFKGLPLGSRAVEIADGATSNYFLRTFGRAARESVCSCEVSYQPSLSQALHLLNGATVHDKIQRGGLIKGLLSRDKDPGAVLDELYLIAFGRSPVAAEREDLLATLSAAPGPQDALEDLFWALLNSREFQFQH